VQHGRRFALPKRLGPVLRYLIGGAVLLVVGIAVGFFFVLQPLFDPQRLEARVDAAVLAWTGQTFAATDGVDLTLLPQPVLTVHRPRLDSTEAGFTLAADRLDLDLELWSLLFGSLVVDRANLVRPHWRLAGDPAATFSALADRLAAHGSRLPFSRLELADGTIATATGEPVLQAMDARFERPDDGGSSRLLATGRPAAAAATQLRLEGQFGAVAAGRPVPLQLDIEAALDGTVHRLALRGELRPAREARGFAGHLTLDLPGTAEPLTGALADIWPALGTRSLPELPLRLAADLDWTLLQGSTTLGLDDATLELAGQTLGGGLLLELGAAPSIDLRLEADRLVFAEGALDFAPLGDVLASALAGSITFRADVIEWRDATLRRVDLDLALDGRGTIEVERATAMLPGPGDLAFSGRFEPPDGSDGARLTGRLEAAAQRPAELVTAFIEPPAFIRDTATLSLSSDVDWQPDVLTLQNAELGLDALQAVGGLAYRPAAGDQRAQLALRALVDRLALDDVVDEAAPVEALEALLDGATETDLAVDLRVSRTSLGPARLGGLALRLESRAGAVVIERLGLDDIAGSAASVSGRVHAASRTFELDLALDVASLSRLLRLAGREPPLALALLGPLNLRGNLAGDLDRAEATMRLEADQFAAEGGASLTDWRSGPSGAVTLHAETAETATLIRQLVGVTVADPDLAGPLRATLEIEVEAGAPTAAVLDGRMGELALALAGERRTAGPGPLDRFDLELGPLSSAAAGQLYQLLTPPLDLVPGPPTRWPGYWPAQELSWDWLAVPDPADVAITLVGSDPAAAPIELRAQLREGALTVPAFRWASPAGLIDAGLAMVARADGRGVDLTLDLALERFAADRLLAFWGLPPTALGGTLDLQAQLATQGSSLRELVGHLRGTLDLVLSDGVLAAASPSDGGIPVERLAASLAIERGVLYLPEAGTAFNGPDGVGRLGGSVDLSAWMMDLELALDAHDGTALVRQELFGPLPTPSVSLPSPPDRGGAPTAPVE